MMKKFALVLALTVITAYTTNICFGTPAAKQKTVSVAPAIHTAIAKYKQKNYTGVIQDLVPYLSEEGDKYNNKDNVLKNDPFAYYYIGLSYAQLGMKSEAQNAYNKVINMNKDDKLVEYSKRAVACLNNQPQCSPNYVDKALPEDDDMTIFIKSGKFLHDDVKQQVQEKTLDQQRDRINNDMAPDPKNYKFLNDASSQIQAQPTDEEIANAVRVLAKVGVNPFI